MDNQLLTLNIRICAKQCRIVRFFKIVKVLLGWEGGVSLLVGVGHRKNKIMFLSQNTCSLTLLPHFGTVCLFLWEEVCTSSIGGIFFRLGWGSSGYSRISQFIFFFFQKAIEMGLRCTSNVIFHLFRNLSLTLSCPCSKEAVNSFKT